MGMPWRSSWWASMMEIDVQWEDFDGIIEKVGGGWKYLTSFGDKANLIAVSTRRGRNKHIQRRFLELAGRKGRRSRVFNFVRYSSRLERHDCECQKDVDEVDASEDLASARVAGLSGAQGVGPGADALDRSLVLHCSGLLIQDVRHLVQLVDEDVVGAACTTSNALEPQVRQDQGSLDFVEVRQALLADAMYQRLHGGGVLVHNGCDHLHLFALHLSACHRSRSFWKRWMHGMSWNDESEGKPQGVLKWRNGKTNSTWFLGRNCWCCATKCNKYVIASCLASMVTNQSKRKGRKMSLGSETPGCSLPHETAGKVVSRNISKRLSSTN